jgi:hypothetical protein
MPQTPHVERHFTAGETVRDVVIGMSDSLTVPMITAVPGREHRYRPSSRAIFDAKPSRNRLRCGSIPANGNIDAPHGIDSAVGSGYVMWARCRQASATSGQHEPVDLRLLRVPANRADPGHQRALSSPTPRPHQAHEMALSCPQHAERVSDYGRRSASCLFCPLSWARLPAPGAGSEATGKCRMSADRPRGLSRHRWSPCLSGGLDSSADQAAGVRISLPPPTRHGTRPQLLTGRAHFLSGASRSRSASLRRPNAG